MRILSFVGTRPEIIKNLAFCRAAARFSGLEFLVYHTGQNFGEDMADGFFRELGIPLAGRGTPPDRTSPGTVARDLMDFIGGQIRAQRPDVVISNTDTTTAYYTAYVGALLRVPVAHVEGGIRCEARLNPEEINRRLADHLADWVFTISDEDTRALVAENFLADRVFMLGDITLDALQIVLREHGIPVVEGGYDVLTVHRQENAGRPDRLTAIIDGVEAAGFRTKFPVHPRTREGLERAGLWERLARSRTIEVRPPLGYIEMVRLVAGCRKVLSDSGGLRREAYMLGKPVIALVDFVWFRKMHELGFAFAADADADKIRWAVESFAPPAERPALFGDGRAGEYILRTLLDAKPRP